ALLARIHQGAGQGTDNPNLQSDTILQDIAYKLGIINDHDSERALLTMFHDLFRTGYLAWGYNVQNTRPPFFHITQQGRKALEHLSHDPMNPDGYLAYVAKQCS